eukprot:XP_012825006.1 PREDICTED: NF-kappa-B inhibitor-like protein 1 isoform X1 [Xenopus tropicalis]
MSFRRERRALRYIQRGDVLKLKSYLRRHRHLILDQPLPDGLSLLHAACAFHEDACALLLLRKGANPLNSDSAGNNALHVVAKEAKSGWKEAYKDLVVPILKRCPRTLDAPNFQGTTPRDILRQVEHLIFDQPQQACSMWTQRDPSSPDMADWNMKIMAESMDEYQEMYGLYEDDCLETLPEPETFEDWADRIYREYQSRHCQSRHYGTKAHKGPVGNTVNILEEQKYLDRQKQMANELRNAQRQRYQKQCEEVFGRVGSDRDGDMKLADVEGWDTEKHRETFIETDKGRGEDNKDNGPGTNLLGFNDIPWPVRGGTAEEMAQYIAAGANPSTPTTYRRYLRTQQVTWHPDRFLQRCGSRLRARDRERVLGTVTALSQELNRLAEQVK